MSIRKRKRLKHKKSWLPRYWYIGWPLTVLIVLGWVGIAAAQQAPSSDNFSATKTLWMLIAGALVFFMNAGFALLEAGTCRQENAINVLAKNLIVFCVSALAFWLFGFRLMFGDSDSGVVGSIELPLQIGFASPENIKNNIIAIDAGFKQLNEEWPGRPLAALFFFQLAFAGTAATIISGAVAERIKFWAFFMFSFLLVGFLYPIAGHWVWGPNGWLGNDLGFKDFAGATVVHSVGGTAALVGALLLKPRDGRFGYNVETDRFEGSDTKDFTPYNLGFSTLGCLILWLGWFGFNGGSAKELQNVPHIITTTMMAAAAGGIAVVAFGAFLINKPKLGSIINGILGGLVGITASSAYVSVIGALFIGGISGILVMIGAFILKAIRVDDPVGAVPVHLFCGIWGTVAVGLFANKYSFEYDVDPDTYNAVAQTVVQCIGSILVCATIAILSLVGWVLIGLFINLWTQFVLLQSGQSGRKPRSSLVELIVNDFFKNVRNGIRVSPADEEKGSDGFFDSQP